MKRTGGEAQWRDRIGRQEASGQAIAAFCKGEGVSHTTFYKWRNRLRRDVAEPMSFIEVSPRGPSPTFEVVLASGVLVRVPPGYDPVALSGLLDVLEHRG